ncbi:hypothetical protein BurJ1DRAFT_3273 [Burkholderiales bacterium JOSHI_001]|nr:hypothetical protein BurJ1DRAFT_3273 [Burkholderiales bacterium JOSHI_001]
MSTVIFISHAGADWAATQAIAALLREAGLTPLLDREELDLGDSFLGFMENALSQATYCLLLWSAAADASPWVRVEWEAAFHRTISDSQRFLLIGLLDEHPVPQLLRPRLQARCFPDTRSGVQQIIALCQRDGRAERDGARAVCAPRAELPPAAGLPVYVTSDLFGRTFPWQVPVDWPVALATEQLVAALGLPRTLDHEGRVGLRFSYGLGRGGQPLEPALQLAAQGVQAHSLLWLSAAVTPFAATGAVAGELAGAQFRAGLPLEAARALGLRSQALGLGPGDAAA